MARSLKGQLTAGGVTVDTYSEAPGDRQEGEGDGLHRLVQELGQKWLDSQTPSPTPEGAP
jgi:hypothetical protein